MRDLTPTREHKLSFGLWTVGWQTRDPFGEATGGPADQLAIEHLTGAR